jgi:exosortase
MSISSEPSSPAALPGASAGPALREGPAAAGVSWRVVGALVLTTAGPLALLFAHHFRLLYELWSTDENYSHGYFVPVVSAYLAWGVLRRQGLPAGGNYALGALLLGLGCLLHFATLLVGLPLVDFLALATMLFGLAVLVGGARWARGFAFPILFLFFMFPLPAVVDLRAAVGLQRVVATAATGVLQVFVPAYQQGNKIVLPGQSLEVGAQCSGMRQVVAFAVLALLTAYFSKRGPFFRLGLVVAAAPVAIVANLLRVLLMAFLTLQFGPEAISEEKILAFGISYHVAWGLLTVTAGLGLLVCVAWWLGRMFPERPADGTAPGPGDEPGASGNPPVPRALVRWLGGAVIGLVAMGLLQQGLVAHLQAAEVVVASSQYLGRPLQGANSFPMTLGAWHGRDTPPDALARKYYEKADDKVSRRYRLEDDSPESGLVCQLWMIHYHDATDRRHFPTGCYGSAGFQEDVARDGEVPLAGGEVPARKFCFIQPKDTDAVTNVYYWHYSLELPESLALSPLQRIHEAWAVRRPSLTVQVTTPAHTPEQLARVADFVRLVDEQLQVHLPPGARRDNDELAGRPTRLSNRAVPVAGGDAAP